MTTPDRPTEQHLATAREIEVSLERSGSDQDYIAGRVGNIARILARYDAQREAEVGRLQLELTAICRAFRRDYESHSSFALRLQSIASAALAEPTDHQ